MVRFGVVADHVIHFLGVDNLGDIGQKLVGEFLFNRIDQGDFVIHDQVGVVGGPGLGRDTRESL